MYLNNFSVRALGGKEIPGGYVEMPHGRAYRLVLRNDRATACDARVELDGTHAGTWRIPRNASITIDRPTHGAGCFTFYEAASAEGQSTGLAPGDPNLGLIKATFTPGRVPRPLADVSVVEAGTPEPVLCNTAPAQASAGGTYTYSANTNVTSANVVAGGSGSVQAQAPLRLRSGSGEGKGKSEGEGEDKSERVQTFATTLPLVPDLAQQTVIHLRLVGCTAPTGEPRPLTAYSTPVPPAVR